MIPVKNSIIGEALTKTVFILPEASFNEFIKFVATNLINLVVPLFIWFLIDLTRPSIQNNEIQFLIATILIHGFILPIKYIIYKLFVFKDSLNN